MLFGTGCPWVRTNQLSLEVTNSQIRSSISLRGHGTHNLSPSIVISSESALKLRPVGYLTAAIFAISPIIDLCISAWPFGLGQPSWRNTFLTILVPTCQSVLLALFIALMISTLAGDRIGALVNASLSGVVAVLLIAMLPISILDWLQLRPQIRAGLNRRFDLVAMWMMTRMVAEAVAFGLLAFAAIRIARKQEQRGTASGELLVGTPRQGAKRPADAVPATVASVRAGVD